jgi:TRAP-type C4-dicarboxylate transport system permease large subunit
LHHFVIGLIFLLTLLYIVLGCFLDGVSVIVLTAPVVLPMVIAKPLLVNCEQLIHP